MGETNPPGAGTPPEIQEADRRLRRFAEDLSAVRIGIAVLASLGIVALLYYGASVFITLFSAALLAYALEPMVGFLCRRTGMRRQYASGIIVFLFIALLYGVLYLAYLGIGSFLEDIPGIADRIRSAPLVESLSEKARETSDLLEEAGRRISLSPAPAREKAAPPAPGQGAETVAGFLLQGLGSLTGVVFSLSFIPFLVYFILADREPLKRRTRELFPTAQQDTVEEILYDIERMMRKYLLGNVAIAMILAAATALVFFLTGLPYPVVLGVSSGMLSIVPYLGLLLALLPALIVGLVSFDSATPLVAIVASVTVFHLAAVNYLTPRLVGSGVRMNATASTAALLVFGWLWGGMGLLLGIPILAVVRCVLENIPSTRRIGRWLGN